ncbi:MAG: hypothetical protein ACPGNV_05705 [Mangrovicoccus sp.]
MPNPSNIKSPISLVAYGRSGTSLLFKAFQQCGNIDCLGETANLVFTSWRALEHIEGLTRYRGFNEGHYQKDAGRLVRNAFSSVFPSEHELWMHKPIGTPKVLWEFPQNKIDEFVDWYWMAFNNSFPESRTFAVIREPRDVFLSARGYWDFPKDQIWKTQWIMYKILAHPEAKLRNIVFYEELVQEPEKIMRGLMKDLDLPFSEDMLAAFGNLHVPESKDAAKADQVLDQKKSKGFSRQDQWAEIEITEMATKALAAYDALHTRSS